MDSANLSRVNRLIKNGRVTPIPKSEYEKLYHCAFTNEVFSVGKVDESCCLILIGLDGLPSVFTVLPERLRRIREILRMTTEWVEISPEVFEKPITYHTLSFMMRMTYSLRNLYSSFNNIYSLKEWNTAIKLALTGDWGTAARQHMENGKLDIDFMVGFLNNLLQPKEVGIKLHYTFLHIKDIRYGVTVGFYLSHDYTDIESCTRDFKRRYDERNQTVVLESGEMEYDNIEDMYKGIFPVLNGFNQWRREGRNVVEMSAIVGIRYYNQEYGRFMYSFESGN